MPVVILGAGPAGLSAGYELAQRGVPVVILEQGTTVGGLSRTVQHSGYRFDIGGHRFYSKSEEVNRLWRDVLGSDLLLRPRRSRIVYRSKYFEYPLQPFQAFLKLGPVEAAQCVASYLRSSQSPVFPEDNLENWLINRFGSRLYQIFFKTYTEKVWGIPCRDISSEWGAQRIQTLNLGVALRNAIVPQWMRGGGVAKSLIKQFLYPRLGPGMMWERLADRIRSLGGRVLLNQKVDGIHLGHNGIDAVLSGSQVYRGRGFISTIALRDFIAACQPAPAYLTAAMKYFEYRDFITVAIVVKKPKVFPDNWIYIHDSAVRAGRIQNYKNWSPEMVPDPQKTCLGLEYFCNEGDGLWQSSDEELVRIAIDDLLRLKMVRREEILEGVALRVPKAYPVYSGHHERGQELVRRFLSEVGNLQVAGRNGMHRYDNQDHAMITGILAARNLCGENHDVWAVNSDAIYLEEYVKSPSGTAVASGA